MGVIVYINGQQVDTDAGTQIRQNLQTNDISSIETRQANYTNQFSIPKTANNVRVMEYMTIAGNVSYIPYQKNECSLYSDSGECFVYKGWALITDGGDDYKIAVYDGVIDLYKALDNKMLSHLDLSEITHEKTIDNIKASWQTQADTGDAKYLYIFADYNGDTGLTNVSIDNPIPQVNIDYLVPSVNVAWLWGKVFEYLQMHLPGITYSGAVFNTFNFKNLFMTFPKGIQAPGTGDLVFAANAFEFDNFLYGYYLDYDNITVNDVSQVYNNRHVKPGVAGSYKIRVKGKINTSALNTTPPPFKIVFCKNREGLPENYQVINDTAIADNLLSGQDFDYTYDSFTLDASDSLCIMIQPGSSNVNNNFTLLNTSVIDLVELTYLDAAIIDFSQAFTDFSAVSFLREVITRFGLTIFKDKFTQNYRFLTLQEMLQNPDVYNWSKKFRKKVSESYIYSSYSQVNWLRYKYNDQEASHNDGYIAIDNVNLTDTRDVIKSVIYSPDRVKSVYLDEATNVYRLWDKEVNENDDEPIKYKPLDKRYYFMRALMVDKSIHLYSNELGTSDDAVAFPRESYFKLTFQDIVQDYYADMQRILDRVQIPMVELWLNENDIVNFDFSKLIYIEQLSNYYLVNKINDYIPGRATRCELVRVLYSVDPAPAQVVVMDKVVTSGTSYSVYFTLNQAYQYIALEYKLASDSGWSSISFASGTNPYTYVGSNGVNQVRLKAGENYSDIIEFTLPSNETIEG